MGGGSAGDHTCARLVAQTALCWGENFFGQLGDGTRANRLRPVIVKATTGGGPLTAIAGIVAGPVVDVRDAHERARQVLGLQPGRSVRQRAAHNATRPIPAAP